MTAPAFAVDGVRALLVPFKKVPADCIGSEYAVPKVRAVIVIPLEALAVSRYPTPHDLVAGAAVLTQTWKSAVPPPAGILKAVEPVHPDSPGCTVIVCAEVAADKPANAPTTTTAYFNSLMFIVFITLRKLEAGVITGAQSKGLRRISHG